MKKQLFIALLASTLAITPVSLTAFAATNTSATTATAIATTSETITTTNSALSTTGEAIQTTTPSIAETSSETSTTKVGEATESAIDTKVQEPEVIAPIKLSLDGAYEKMLADSPQATLAKWAKDSETSVAKGTSERLSSIRNLEKSDDEAAKWALDTSNKAMLQANRSFAYKQIPKNYDATINKLKYDTYEMYYNYKYTEAQVQVAKDNLDRTQSIYDNTMLKYKLGTVSKLDTLNAETSLNTAKDNYSIAVNGFEQMKMNFNLFMGYNLHQKVTLTDDLSPMAFPEKTLKTSIKEALENRNEISEANFNAEMAQYDLHNFKAYPKNSATYLSKKATLLMAQEAQKTAPSKVEIDVRTKYMDMKQKYDAVTSGKTSYENSKEASRLGELQYESGVITMSDLEGINFNTFNTQQAYFKALLDYNLAVEAYKLSSGIGTEIVGIR